jgi:cytochrome c oxidase subunit 2
MRAAAVFLTMPPQASTVAGDVDAPYHFILALCTFFFVLIVLVTVVFAIRYRYREGDDRQVSPRAGSHLLELVWSVVPGILLMVIFAWGFNTYVAMAVPPDNALDVRVTAQKWNWSFGYPKNGGIQSPELVVPLGQPVRLTMSSQDVLHSLYVPAFRVKQDVLPNRYTSLWFEATQVGEFDIFCTEYCGTSHSQMLSKVRVLDDAGWKEWVGSGGGMGGEGMDPVEWGGKLFVSLGCNACHSTDGTRLVGPTWRGAYGSSEKLTDGTTVVVDDNYVRESVMNPAAKIVEGYPPIMPPYAGRVSDAQMNALIDYMKSLK